MGHGLPSRQAKSVKQIVERIRACYIDPVEPPPRHA
jgi:hypothetical protein